MTTPELTPAHRGEYNLGRRHFHDKQPWESLRPGSYAMKGYIAAATEAADEAQRLSQIKNQES